MLIAGMNDLNDAVAFALAAQSNWPPSMYMPDGQFVMTYDSGEKAPDNEVLGPVTPRGGPSGLVYRGGHKIAEWGDVDRADMTFSVAKSYLALLAGLALGDGLIKSLDDKVAGYALDDGFESEQNRDITWRHLLTQTSEWSGTVFGKEDRIDHNRVVGVAVADAPKGTRRAMKKPGTFYEYNDVRVNRLSRSLLQVFREPLPQVLKRRIMDPIGGSQGWRWDGYRNSYDTIDGKPMLSVPGGGHWGGGLFIGARDHARFGLLMARGGDWGGRSLVPADWIKQTVAPSPTLSNYGFLWWLNRGPTARPAIPASAYWALGAGTNVILVDVENDLVAVLRWIDGAAYDGFLAALYGALR